MHFVVCCVICGVLVVADWFVGLCLLYMVFGLGFCVGFPEVSVICAL